MARSNVFFCVGFSRSFLVWRFTSHVAFCHRLPRRAFHSPSQVHCNEFESFFFGFLTLAPCQVSTFAFFKKCWKFLERCASLHVKNVIFFRTKCKPRSFKFSVLKLSIYLRNILFNVWCDWSIVYWITGTITLTIINHLIQYLWPLSQSTMKLSNIRLSNYQLSRRQLPNQIINHQISYEKAMWVSVIDTDACELYWCFACDRTIPIKSECN